MDGCMIRVFVRAPTAIARAGVEGLLRERKDFTLVRGLDGNRSQAPGMAGGPHAADVAVVAAESLADATAREALDWASAGVPIVLLVPAPAAEPVWEALRAGVKSVLASDVTTDELAIAVEAAAAGLTVIASSELDSLPVTVFTAGARADALGEPLTHREIEVLRLLAAGLSNKEIALRLEISDHTAKFHVASIMGKLGANSRTEAVTLGIRNRLIMI
jgi:NarL family two-component system response regulator YdfI